MAARWEPRAIELGLDGSRLARIDRHHRARLAGRLDQPDVIIGERSAPAARAEAWQEWLIGLTFCGRI